MSPENIESKIKKLHREAPLTDIHAHPSLKAWLFGQNLGNHSFSPGMYYPLCCRTDFETLEKGNVGVLWASHTVPEVEMLQKSFLTRLGARLSGLEGKLTSGTALDRLFEIIELMEQQVAQSSEKIEIAHSVDDIKRIRKKGKIAIVHSVEGGNVLEGNPENLDKLAESGVACFTLSHLYPKGIAEVVNPVPEDSFIRKIISFESEMKDKPPLTELGKSILEKLEKLNMVLDITHCSPKARKQIFSFLDDSVAIIASHQGVKKFNPSPRNLSDEEILEIVDRDGGIGLMFCSHWLNSKNPSDGLNALWKNMKHIYEVTGSWENIMLGTDFDGFTTPPSDIKDPSKFGLVTRMLLEKDLQEETVKKIIGGNAMRILKKTWR